MAKDLLREGMEKFSSGDLAGATRLWLELVEQEPDNEHARSYLARIREVAPELLDKSSGDVAQSEPETKNGIEVQSGEGAVVKVSSSKDEPSVEELETKLHHFLEVDDFSDAWEVAKELLAMVPDHAKATSAIQTCEEKLELIYASKVGDQNGVPQVLIPPEEILWLDLDHRAGFVLAQIDGQSSFREILLVTGMNRVDSLRILARLVKDKVIGV